MATADSQWPLFYQGLQHFKPQAGTSAGTSDPDTVLLQSDQLSSLFIELANQNFAGVIAQLNLTPRQLPVNLARIVKMMALALILSRGYGWQNRRSQQLLQAIILPAALAPDAADYQRAWVLTAKILQQLNKQHPLLPLLVAACNAQRQPSWQQHPDGPLLSLLSQLAEQLLPVTGSQISLEQLLLQYTTRQTAAPDSQWFYLLQQLVERQALPGRFARETRPGSNAQHYWFISGMASAPTQPAAVYVRQFDPASKTVGHEVQQLPLAGLTLLNPQYFRNPSWLALLEPDDGLWPAPADFTLDICLEQSVFYQLSKLNITKQVKLLETQPLIGQFLQLAATNLSRQQLAVNRLRHAISTLGQDALCDWVAQAELHQYCLRQAHPHHAWLEQLQHCRAQALLLLSEKTSKPLTTGCAAVVAGCATLSLWQHPTLPQTSLARHVQGQLLLGLHIQQHLWQAKSYPEQVQQLLQHYQQSDWSAAMDDWHSRQAAPLTLLLKLSWQLTLAVFFADDASIQRLNALLPPATARLGLAEHPAAYWQQQLTAASQCYYPLPKM